MASKAASCSWYLRRPHRTCHYTLRRFRWQYCSRHPWCTRIKFRVGPENTNFVCCFQASDGIAGCVHETACLGGSALDFDADGSSIHNEELFLLTCSGRKCVCAVFDRDASVEPAPLGPRSNRRDQQRRNEQTEPQPAHKGTFQEGFSGLAPLTQHFRFGHPGTVRVLQSTARIQGLRSPLTIDAPFAPVSVAECRSIAAFQLAEGLFADTASSSYLFSNPACCPLQPVASYAAGTGSAQILPSISPNSLRFRCPSANSSQ